MPVKLPDVHDLAQFIDSPLSEEEKIPITWKETDLLVSSQSVGMIDNFCNRSDVVNTDSVRVEHVRIIFRNRKMEFGNGLLLAPLRFRTLQ